MDFTAQHTAFVPLANAASVQVALARAGIIDDATAAHCVSLQFKAYRRPQAWSRAHARVCYRVVPATRRGPADGLPHGELYLQGWARLSAADAASGGRDEAMRATLESLTLRLWRLPEDDALPGLRPLWSLSQAGRAVPSRLVSYRPGERALLRFPAHGGTPATFAKVFPSVEQARRVHARVCRVHDSVLDSFDTATPLALDTHNAAVWQLGMPGARVADLLQQIDDAALPRRLARALAVLHAIQHDNLALLHVADQLEDAIKKLERLQILRPSLSEALMTQRQALEQDARHHVSRPLVALHGDFHLRQWLMAGSQLTLCDLDEVCLGAPEVDLASLIMDLSLYGLPTARVTDWIRQLTEVYAAQAPWGLDPGTLRWQLRIQAANKMHRAWVQLHADLQGQCQHYLAHLNTCLESLQP